MPKTKRDFLKRDIAIAVNHIEEAQIRLLELKEVFAPVHPEYAAMLDAILVVLETGISFISDFCMQAWATIPPTWDAWRNPGTHEKLSRSDPEYEALVDEVVDTLIAEKQDDPDANP